jgi:ATP-binding cassette subfamily F protein uup
MDTLDLLIDLLSDYKGTLIIVSHDRDFLDKLTTSIIALEGDGLIQECIGGYQDYLRQYPPPKAVVQKSLGVKEIEERPKPAPRRFSYHEKREYEMLPARMDTLMRDIAQAEARLEDPAFYQNHLPEFMNVTEKLKDAKEDLNRAETRWLELDEMMRV